MFLYQFEDTRRSQNSSKRQRWSGETDANGNQLPPFVDATKDTFTLTLTNGDTESPKTQSYKLKIVGVVSEESEDYFPPERPSDAERSLQQAGQNGF